MATAETHTRRAVLKTVLGAASAASAGVALQSVPANAALSGDPWYDVKSDFGARGDGITDDTTAIQAAFDAARGGTGGTVYFPPGTYIAAGLTFFGKVRYLGAGIENTILKLKGASNTFLMQSFNFPSLTGTNGTGGEVNYSFQDITLDGNKANNGTATVPMWRQYGYGFVLSNVRIRNGNSDGLYSEWATSLPPAGQDSMEAHISGLKVHDCGGHGVHWNGPHDSNWTNGESYFNAAHGIFIDSNAGGFLCANVHSYGNSQAYAWYLGATGCGLTNCVAEGASQGQIAIDANDCWVVGSFIFGAGAQAPVGIVIGPTGARSGIRVQAKIVNCTSGALALTNDGNGANSYDILAFQTSGSVITGALAPQSTLIVNVGGVAGNIARLTGAISPGTPAGANQAGQIFQGSGVPSNINGNDGDFYFRTDTPVAVNQRLYVKSAGVWAGIL